MTTVTGNHFASPEPPSSNGAKASDVSCASLLLFRACRNHNVLRTCECAKWPPVNERANMATETQPRKA
eukprot:CAMPEP_0184080226 /NCGR_PEP_ID=MMETSP0974-20121125/2091_1 /TAXON_ID=483370 /ORGANISM="non described non described, Strain CCMP2097" /LENGTH=68 /DNA_ID=CAMNT_0026382883 /DNA_START=39 /DNA_END=245 /DNA_ORIENTATION=+